MYESDECRVGHWFSNAWLVLSWTTTSQCSIGIVSSKAHAWPRECPLCTQCSANKNLNGSMLASHWHDTWYGSTSGCIDPVTRYSMALGDKIFRFVVYVILSIGILQLDVTKERFWYFQLHDKCRVDCWASYHLLLLWQDVWNDTCSKGRKRDLILSDSKGQTTHMLPRNYQQRKSCDSWSIMECFQLIYSSQSTCYFLWFLNPRRLVTKYKSTISMHYIPCEIFCTNVVQRSEPPTCQPNFNENKKCVLQSSGLQSSGQLAPWYQK